MGVQGFFFFGSGRRGGVQGGGVGEGFLVETDFGQSVLGHPNLANLGQSNFSNVRVWSSRAVV